MFEYKRGALRFVVLVAAIIVFSFAGSVQAEEASSSISVHLTVVASTTKLFEGEVSVVACDSDGDGTAPVAFTGFCLVSQAPVSSTWSWWGADAFLDSINGVANDNANGWYWGWFSNLTYGQTALNKYTLVAGDRILVINNSTPLRLSVSTTTPMVGDVIAFTVEEFGYDASWNPVWNPSASSSLSLGTEPVFSDANGAYSYTVSSSDTLSVVASKSGNYVSSPAVLIAPIAASTEEPASVPETSGGSAGGSSQSNVTAAEAPVFSLAAAVDFLLNLQEANGSFGSAMYTDWAAVALKAASRAGDADAGAGLARVKEYLVDKTISASASLTDHERHAFTLMAVGINPYTGTGVNHIQKIIDAYDGEQFGDKNLENDDIFALLVLSKAGYKADDQMIKNSVEFLVGRQSSSGAWIGVDVTAAAIQALRSLISLPGVSSAVARAEEYIQSQQAADGGFGNIYSLSWALQALGGALAGADDALAAQQQEDGGFGEQSASEENRLWATSYAIPGALHRSWPDLMSSFKKVEPKVEEDDDEVREEDEETVQEDEEPVASSTPVAAIQIAAAPAVTPVVVASDVPQADAAGEQENKDDAQLQEEFIPLTASAVDVASSGEPASFPWVQYGVVGLLALGGLFLFFRFVWR